jgi:5-formyltetrahydrofolate cyclo-ligase
MTPAELDDAKRELRPRMRQVRRDVPDAAERSQRIWAAVEALPVVQAAGVVMAFRSVPGEPDTSAFLEWCERHGKRVVLPEPHRDARDPIAPELVDVVVVPGLAFTPAGARLGQGGGWYDRFLARVRSDCRKVGVCFAPQVVADLPCGVHDVLVDDVISDTTA